MLSTLNEAQARWFVADKALDLGRGGVSRLSQVTGMSRMTITKAIKELRGRGVLQPAAMGRVRREGVGRKPIGESSPSVMKLIARMVRWRSGGDRGGAGVQNVKSEKPPRGERLRVVAQRGVFALPGPATRPAT